jgi:predicted nucleic acid-binding protein
LGELIDSSVFIAAERGDAPIQVALALKRPYEDSFLSVVTVGELLHGVYLYDKSRSPSRLLVS